MTPPVSRKELLRRKETIEKCLKAGYPPPGIVGRGQPALNKAAEILGLSRSTLRDSLPSLERQNISVDWALYKDPETAEPDQNIVEPDWIIEQRRLNDRVAELTRENRELARVSAIAEDLRQVCFNLAATTPDTPEWVVKYGTTKHHKSVPLLFCSDFQWGEVIKPEEVDYANAFNSAIASERYKRLISKTIELAFEHFGKPDYPGIFYLRGGDAISGDIHADLRETNDLRPNPAVKDLAKHEMWGIEKLADAFGRVHVISVPGNHDRSTEKPRAKGYVDVTWDDLLSWHLEMMFAAKGDKRVTFSIPRSGDAYFQVAGVWIVMTHGDRMGTGGGQGFIGPAAPIIRGQKKVREWYARLRKHVDYVLNGHYHFCFEPPGGFSNGSLPGCTQYSLKYRLEPQPPMQWLLFAHPKWGMTGRWKLRLDSPKENDWSWPE